MLVNFILIVVFGFLFFRDWLYNRSAKQAISELQRGGQKLQQENTELLQRIEEFASLENVEKKIKQDLNLARPGETIIVFKQSQTSTTSTLPQSTKKDLSYYIFRTREAIKSFWREINEE